MVVPPILSFTSIVHIGVIARGLPGPAEGIGVYFNPDHFPAI
jgi:hypothetical protein